MLPVEVVVAAIVGTAIALLYQGLAIVWAFAMPTLGRRPPGPPPPGRVSVIIAARNEERDLPRTLDGLLGQDLPGLEIVVVDGGSTDSTAAVVDARAPRVRRLIEPPLPTGWVGKNWACWTGAQATSGDWLLFVDADVATDPTAVRSVLGWAVDERADLATIAPKVEMVGFWERVVLPFWVQMVLVYFRVPRVNRADSKSAMANGQFLLIRRTTYDAIGGHAAIRGTILEDVALARRVRTAGGRLRVANAVDLAATRMYLDGREMFEGLVKNVHGVDFSAGRQVAFLVALVGFFYLPLAVLPIGLWGGSPILVGLGAFAWVALFGKHVGFARGVGAPAAYGLLWPLAVAYYLRLVGTSLVRGVRGRPISWKGRSYGLRRADGPNR